MIRYIPGKTRIKTEIYSHKFEVKFNYNELKKVVE